MTPSTACAALIQRFETCRLRAYRPTPSDRWTCGWGSTGDDIGPDTVWTQAQADARFVADLKAFAAGVSRLITGPTTQGQFDALVCFAYNVGLGALAHSTLLRMHNSGDHAGAALQFADWVDQNGKPLDGLIRRRAAEAELYKWHIYT